jgi:predicted permease
VSAVTLAMVIGQLLVLVGVGVLLRVSGLLAAEDARVLNTVIIFAGLPALVFRAVRPAQLSWDLALVSAIAWAVAGIGLALAWVASRFFKLSRPAQGGFLICASLGNTGFIGYPIALGLLGNTGLVRAVFYDVFGTMIMLLTVGVLIASRFGGATERPSLVRELLAAPALLAVVLALATRSVPIPRAVMDGLDVLARLVVPAIMISLGLSLKPKAIGRYAAPIGAVAVIKLLVLPLVAIGLGSGLLRDASATRLLALQAGTPAMMLTLVYGMRFELDTELIGSAILVTTAACAVTIPLVQTLLR